MGEKGFLGAESGTCFEIVVVHLEDTIRAGEGWIYWGKMKPKYLGTSKSDRTAKQIE